MQVWLCCCYIRCTAATRAVRLQHGLCRFNTGCDTATRGCAGGKRGFNPFNKPVKTGFQPAFTGVQYWLCCCYIRSTAATRAVLLQHGLCPVCSVPLQHGLCRCYSDEIAVNRYLIRAIPLKHGLYHRNMGCAAVTRAVPLQNGLCRCCNMGCATAAPAVPNARWAVLQERPLQQEQCHYSTT